MICSFLLSFGPIDQAVLEENLFLRISQLETRLPIAAICQLAQNEKDLLSTSYTKEQIIGP
jgi:hypothetical protein